MLSQSKEKYFLGIELGSTRIKTVLINHNFEIVGSSYHGWENEYKDGFWTYDEENIWLGIQDAYKKLKDDVKSKRGICLKKIEGIGVSAMMHGYLSFDDKGELLVPFRTWRNNNTFEASQELSQLLEFNIPERWSIAHLYQSVLNQEDHVPQIAFMTTLSGYVHWKLTGEKVIGVGDASGIFPMDSKKLDYDRDRIDAVEGKLSEKGYDLVLKEILPKPIPAGEKAGYLTQEGALLLDPEGDLAEGSVFAPPEGDAGTGMVATNSVKASTGNVSVGTSAFASIVLEKSLTDYYPEIDVVMTPDGKEVAMIHANNCSTEINEWINLFAEVIEKMGHKVDKNQLYETMFKTVHEADSEVGILSYGYHSGENITRVKEGRPLLLRNIENKFNSANIMKSLLYSAFAVLRVGLEILEKEELKIEKMYAHGGLLKTKDVAQEILAAVFKTPISVVDTAGEGGAWGMALLTLYSLEYSDKSLVDYLEQEVFSDHEEYIVSPDPKKVHEYDEYMGVYVRGLSLEKKSSELI